MNKGTIRIAQFVIKMLYLNNLDYDTRFLIELLNHSQPLLNIIISFLKYEPANFSSCFTTMKVRNVSLAKFHYEIS